MKKYWQIQNDFLSLFQRDNSKENYFHCIDGIRSIASLLITSLHIIGIFTALLLPYPDIQWQRYLHSNAFALLNLMSFALEIFFMLSSFLLTYKLISVWNKNSLNNDNFILKEYPLLIIRRILRFWPGFLLVSLILLIFGEPFYPGSGFFFELFRNLNLWLFFQNYINIDYWYATFAPLWSISLDMQIHIVLPLILYLFYLNQKRISILKSLYLLLILSIIFIIIQFNPQTMSILSLSYQYSSIRILSPPYLNQWFERNYNLTKFSSIPESQSLKLFMSNIYLPLECRFGSFIIGSILAIKLLQTYEKSSLNTKTKFQIFKKYFFIGLIFFHLSTLIQPSQIPPNPPDFLIKIFLGISRQLFTIGQAFLLFTGLCPSSHPYHSKWIKSFLSFHIWIPLSKLSYLVYLIHLRLAFELIFHGPLTFLKSYSITYATLISLPIVILLSQVISIIWYLFIEKPIERFINYQFTKIQSTKNI
ncbi:hypothetical protein I4U23_031256 [Adineta vaga]|nr:hypothetical protein I4U23_031256 [Adineta vaga]